jgi:hypothetical protein
VASAAPLASEAVSLQKTSGMLSNVRAAVVLVAGAKVAF